MFTKYIPNPKLRSLAEWAAALAFAVLLFVLVRNFLFRVADVSGTSMEPTLQHGDMVILSRFTYLFGNPERDDIIAFPYKENPSEHYIKRIIGLPGDVIDLERSYFTVNGVPLNDAFSNDPVYDPGDIIFPYTVDEGCYFVLGDNRNASKDSRYSTVGCIPKKQMVGKVLLRFWPVGGFGRIG